MRVCKAAGIAFCLFVVPVIQGCFGAAATGTAVGGITMQDRRTPGKYIDDEIIELNVLSSLLADERILNQTHVNATSYNGLVLLTGEAPGDSLRKRIVEVARVVRGVRAVHNEIALQAPSTLAARAADSLLTGKVKIALLARNNVRAVHVKVVTERGIVYLMGLLRQDEADRATEIARRVAGVKRVVKVMEYIE
jgi:osmotically-inducible protein OsmY